MGDKWGWLNIIFPIDVPFDSSYLVLWASIIAFVANVLILILTIVEKVK